MEGLRPRKRMIPFETTADVCTGSGYRTCRRPYCYDNPFIGDYDASSNMLNIGFKQLPSIALEVPAGEAEGFGDAKNLKFENAVYVLNDKDEFELAYVEVKNETNQ